MWLCSLLGVAWHAVVSLFNGASDVYDFLPGVPAGVLAGVAAGALTLWSRRRWNGREAVRWVFATYYIGLLVYVVARVVTAALLQGVGFYPVDMDTWSNLPTLLALLLTFGTLFGAVLLPLCWATRALVWRNHVRVGQ